MRAFLLLALCALLLGACRLEAHGGSGSSYFGSSGGSLTIDAARQTGAMGDIATFDGGGDRLESFKDSSSTFVQIDSIGRGWWVMSAISIDRDIDTLVPGITYSTSAVADSIAGGSAPEPISAEVRGCSGPEYTNYTYDDLARETTFTVEQLPSGERRVHYDCTFVSDGGATQHTTGSFDYVPAGTTRTGGADGVAVASH